MTPVLGLLSSVWEAWIEFKPPALGWPSPTLVLMTILRVNGHMGDLSPLAHPPNSLSNKQRKLRKGILIGHINGMGSLQMPLSWMQ